MRHRRVGVDVLQVGLHASRQGTVDHRDRRKDSEFGVTASNGGFPVDTEQGDLWVDMLEEYGISYVMWNFSRTTEPCAALNRDSLKTKDFTIDDFKESGKWLINTIRERSARKTAE